MNISLDQKPDPRVFFAAERTLLAWFRTGIAIIGLGFLVSKFGLFLTIITSRPIGVNQYLSNALGLTLVILGTVLTAVTAIQHRGFVKQLDEPDLPAGYSATLSSWLAACLAIAGLVLAGYLLLTTF